jgi:hypothetical protein
MERMERKERIIVVLEIYILLENSNKSFLTVDRSLKCEIQLVYE